MCRVKWIRWSTNVREYRRHITNTDDIMIRTHTGVHTRTHIHKHVVWTERASERPRRNSMCCELKCVTLPNRVHRIMYVVVFLSFFHPANIVYSCPTLATGREWCRCAHGCILYVKHMDIVDWALYMCLALDFSDRCCVGRLCHRLNSHILT